MTVNDAQKEEGRGRRREERRRRGRGGEKIIWYVFDRIVCGGEGEYINKINNISKGEPFCNKE